MRIRFPAADPREPAVEVEVRGSDPSRWAAAIARLHGGGMVLPPEAVSAREADLVVAVGDTFRIGSGEERLADRAEFMSALEARISQAVMSRNGDLRFLHAAGLGGSGGATLVLGESGAGKSGLALAWSRAGGAIHGDDVVLLDERGRIHAHPRPIKVARPQIEAAGIDPRATLEFDPAWEELWVEPARLGGWSAPQAVDRVLVARWDPAAPAGGEVGALSRTAALRALLQSLLLPPDEDPGSTLERCIRVIERASAVTLRFSSAADAMHYLASPTDAPAVP